MNWRRLLGRWAGRLKRQYADAAFVRRMNRKVRCYERACVKIASLRSSVYELEAENLGLRRRIEELETEARLAEQQLEGTLTAHQRLLEMLKAEIAGHVRQRTIAEVLSIPSSSEEELE